MVCLGLEPGAAGWKAQMNPLSYGQILKRYSLESRKRNNWLCYQMARVFVQNVTT